MKDLKYYKDNCEDDYLHAPISVLRYITELEKRKIPSIYGSKTVGSYEITGQQNNQQHFCFTKKPKLINRLFCKWCLGWTWVDN